MLFRSVSQSRYCVPFFYPVWFLFFRRDEHRFWEVSKPLLNLHILLFRCSFVLLPNSAFLKIRKHLYLPKEDFSKFCKIARIENSRFLLAFDDQNCVILGPFHLPKLFRSYQGNFRAYALLSFDDYSFRARG